MTLSNMENKKEQSDEENESPMIQIMTISLFIILLAFFILLNTIGVIDETKKRIVVSSIVENFGGPDPDDPTTGNYPDAVFTNGVSPVDFKDLVAGKDKALKDVTIEGTKKRTLLTIPESLLFKRYRYSLTKKGRSFLRKLAAVIRENKFPVDIGCHIDNVPVKAVAGVDSRELTTLRSNRILRYLVENGNISADQLTSVGWGGSKPVFPNKTAQTRNMNRRIEVVFVHDKEKLNEKGFFIFRDFFFHVDD